MPDRLGLFDTVEIHTEGGDYVEGDQGDVTNQGPSFGKVALIALGVALGGALLGLALKRKDDR